MQIEMSSFELAAILPGWSPDQRIALIRLLLWPSFWLLLIIVLFTRILQLIDVLIDFLRGISEVEAPGLKFKRPVPVKPENVALPPYQEPAETFQEGMALPLSQEPAEKVQISELTR